MVAGLPSQAPVREAPKNTGKLYPRAMHTTFTYRFALLGLSLLASGCAGLSPGWDWDERAGATAPLPARVVAPGPSTAAVSLTAQEVTCRDVAWRASFADMSARDLLYAQAYRDCMNPPTMGPSPAVVPTSLAPLPPPSTSVRIEAPVAPSQQRAPRPDRR